MSEDKFWEIIEQSKGDDDQFGHAERLTKQLKGLNTDQILKFYELFCYLHDNADLGDVWAAAMLLNGGHGSDDGFEYFRNWLIAQGRSTYEIALIQIHWLQLAVKPMMTGVLCGMGNIWLCNRGCL